jgi:DNA repair exonuclease SbcCD nuclease subunit
MRRKSQKTIIKFLILTDTHFGIHFSNKPRSTLRFALGNRFFDQAESIFKLAIEKHKVDFVIHCGDFFNRSKPNQSIIAKATSLLLWISKYIPVYIVPGNHERGKLPIGLLHYQKNVHIFTRPCSFFFRKKNVVVKITGFPYVRHNIKSEFKSLVEKAWITEIGSNDMESAYNILLLHQLIQGSKVEHYTFNHGNNVINFSDISRRFHLIAVGHVHRFQFLYSLSNRVISSHTNTQVIQDFKQNEWKFIKEAQGVKNQYPIICYPGTCERVSMMERNEHKGYVIGRINHDNSRVRLTFHPVKSIPMKKILWNQPGTNSDNLISQTCNIIRQLASVSRVNELGGVLRINSSESIDHSTLSRVKAVAKRKKVILNLSNYRY